MSEKILQLLKSTKLEVAEETFWLISLSDEYWKKLLENPELSPRMTSPFMIFKDKYEVTLLLDETDFQRISSAIPTAQKEGNFRLMTFNQVLDFSVVGFLAKVTEILAEENISIIAVSAYSRDHLLIKQNDLAKALMVLRHYIEDIC